MTHAWKSNNPGELAGPEESPPTERGLTREQRAFAAVVGRAIAEAWLKECRNPEGGAATEKSVSGRDSL
jgi:hypothetical protein